MSEMLDTILWPMRKNKNISTTEEEDDDNGNEFEDYEMKEEYIYKILGNPTAGYTFKFKGKHQEKEYTGWAQKYRDHWVVSPHPIPKSILDIATIQCYEYMRDFLEVNFDSFEEDDDEYMRIFSSSSLDQKKLKKISVEDAYRSLERITVWVSRNYWEFERPPIEGIQPTDSIYFLTFNNESSDHYLWCMIDPNSNSVSFDSCLMNQLFE